MPGVASPSADCAVREEPSKPEGGPDSGGDGTYWKAVAHVSWPLEVTSRR
ncbi:hypothetical protein [Streptomyces sp. NPDC090112]